MKIWKIDNSVYQSDEIVTKEDWGQVMLLNPDLIIDLTRLAIGMPRGFRQVFLNYHIKTAEMPDPQKFHVMLDTAIDALQRNMRLLVYCKHGGDRSPFFIASMYHKMLSGAKGSAILTMIRKGHPDAITAKNYLDEIASWK